MAKQMKTEFEKLKARVTEKCKLYDSFTEQAIKKMIKKSSEDIDSSIADFIIPYRMNQETKFNMQVWKRIKPAQPDNLDQDI